MNELNIARVVPVADVGSPVERLAILFDSHHDRLYRLARRLTDGTDDALDLVQETFLKAARYTKSIPVGFANEEAWLVRVLINTRRDQWRKSCRRKGFEAAASKETCRHISGDPEGAAIAKASIWRALDSLAPRRRAIVIMHELDEMTIRDIASLLGISQITVRWHLSRGRHDLATALKAHTEDKK